MPSSYPTGLDAFTTGTLTGIVSGSDHGNKGDALNKIEAELGVSPSGAAATVTARFDDIDSVEVRVAAPTGVGATDRAAVQAAISASGWPTNRAVLKFRHGTYVFDGTSVSVDGGGAGSTPALIFQGDGTEFATATSSANAMVNVTNSIVSVTHVKFVGIKFYPNAGSGGRTAVKLTNAQMTVFDRCRFSSSFALGVEITGTSTYTKFIGCDFDNLARGILMSGTASYTHIVGCSFGEQLVGTPLNWIEAATAASYHVTVTGCNFYSTGATLPILRIMLGYRWTITGNTFYESIREAIWIDTDGSSYGHTISGNTFSEGSRHDIYINGGQRNVISGNTFGPRKSGTATDTYACVRLKDPFTTNAGSRNAITGNVSQDGATGVTNVVEADATCKWNAVTGNIGAAGFVLADASNVLTGNITA